MMNSYIGRIRFIIKNVPFSSVRSSGESENEITIEINSVGANNPRRFLDRRATGSEKWIEHPQFNKDSVAMISSLMKYSILEATEMRVAISTVIFQTFHKCSNAHLSHHFTTTTIYTQRSNRTFRYRFIISYIYFFFFPMFMAFHGKLRLGQSNCKKLETSVLIYIK